MPFLEEVNLLCKFYRKKRQGIMITNGYLLNPDNLLLLYSHGITQYQITLDGFDEVHNKNRPLMNGDETFSVIYNNLLYMLSNKSLQRLCVAIRINTTKDLLLRSKEWMHLYDVFSNDKRFIINLGVVENRGGNTKQIYENMLITEADDLYQTTKRELRNHIFYEDYICPNYYVCKDFARNSYTIETNGEIRLCSKTTEDNIVGKLKTNGQIEYFKRDKSRNSLLGRPDICDSCSIEPLCHGKQCGLKFICNKHIIEVTLREKLLKELDKIDVLYL